MGERRQAYKILVGKSEGKRPLGRPWRRWEDNIRVNVSKRVGRLWTGFIWLRTGTKDGLLWTRK
jgi:hypothetical protein